MITLTISLAASGQRIIPVHLYLGAVQATATEGRTPEKSTWLCSSPYIGKYLSGEFTLERDTRMSSYRAPKGITTEGPGHARVVPSQRVFTTARARFYDAGKTYAFMELRNFLLQRFQGGDGTLFQDYTQSGSRLDPVNASVTWKVTNMPGQE